MISFLFFVLLVCFVFQAPLSTAQSSLLHHHHNKQICNMMDVTNSNKEAKKSKKGRKMKSVEEPHQPRLHLDTLLGSVTGKTSKKRKSGEKKREKKSPSKNGSNTGSLRSQDSALTNTTAASTSMESSTSFNQKLKAPQPQRSMQPCSTPDTAATSPHPSSSTHIDFDARSVDTLSFSVIDWNENESAAKKKKTYAKNKKHSTNKSLVSLCIEDDDFASENDQDEQETPISLQAKTIKTMGADLVVPVLSPRKKERSRPKERTSSNATADRSPSPLPRRSALSPRPTPDQHRKVLAMEPKQRRSSMPTGSSHGRQASDAPPRIISLDMSSHHAAIMEPSSPVGRHVSCSALDCGQSSSRHASPARGRGRQHRKDLIEKSLGTSKPCDSLGALNQNLQHARSHRNASPSPRRSHVGLDSGSLTMEAVGLPMGLPFQGEASQTDMSAATGASQTTATQSSIPLLPQSKRDGSAAFASPRSPRGGRRRQLSLSGESSASDAPSAAAEDQLLLEQKRQARSSGNLSIGSQHSRGSRGRSPSVRLYGEKSERKIRRGTRKRSTSTTTRNSLYTQETAPEAATPSLLECIDHAAGMKLSRAISMPPEMMTVEPAPVPRKKSKSKKSSSSDKKKKKSSKKAKEVGEGFVVFVPDEDKKKKKKKSSSNPKKSKTALPRKIKSMSALLVEASDALLTPPTSPLRKSSSTKKTPTKKSSSEKPLSSREKKSRSSRNISSDCPPLPLVSSPSMSSDGPLSPLKSRRCSIALETIKEKKSAKKGKRKTSKVVP
jgi:hypothetical protein